jgi:hypothetical protein
MTDQDEDQDPGKLGSKPAGHSADVEGHASPEAPTVEDDDDVEGHFGSIRPTGSKGE